MTVKYIDEWDLLKKTDNELKIVMKKTIFSNYDSEKIRWNYIFENYFEYMNIERSSDEINKFKNLSEGSSGVNYDFLYEAYDIKNRSYKLTNIDINIGTKALHIQIFFKYRDFEYINHYKFYSKNNINEILEFLFYMLKESITIHNDFLNILDSFVGMDEEEVNMEKIKNDLL